MRTLSSAPWFVHYDKKEHREAAIGWTIPMATLVLLAMRSAANPVHYTPKYRSILAVRGAHTPAAPARFPMDYVRSERCEDCMFKRESDRAESSLQVRKASDRVRFDSKRQSVKCGYKGMLLQGYIKP
jgi:hypothetical protein